MNTESRLMKRIWFAFKYFYRLFFIYLFRVFPIKTNKIVFTSFYGKFCNDIPRAIFDELEKDERIECVWIVNDKQVGTGIKVKKAKINSIKHIYHLSTARVWIDNSRKPLWTRKRKRQFYIQTWHGGLALKKVEKDAIDSLNKSYIKMAKNDSNMADLFLSETRVRTKNYLSAFWYSGDILTGRFLRNEKLDKDIKKNFYSDYHIDKDRKIVLYAPTFRNDYNESVFVFDFKKILLALERKFESKYLLCIKLHPNLSSHILNLKTCDSNVVDVTKYDDMQSLIKITDILITDFSGCMFDAFRNEKKVFLFAKDYEQYITNNRDLYLNITDLPSSFAKSETDLYTNIQNFDSKSYFSKVALFNERIGYYNNDGLKGCVEIIYGVLGIKNG